MKFKILIVPVLFFVLAVPVLSQDDMAGMMIPEERKFTVGGWASLIGKQAFSEDVSASDDRNFQFAQADLNLYFKFNPHKDLEFFTEIAYCYFPGPVQEIDMTTYNTTYFNNSVADNILGMSWEWGSIMVVRAYMEWHMFNFFKIRMGRMLTHFGIWSQDHGQPVITPVRPPSIIAPYSLSDTIPGSITGFEILGTVPMGQVGDWGKALFDYAVYVSNNDTDLDSFGDDDTNWGKACGAYFNFSIPLSVVSLDFGLSYYRGKYIRLGYTDVAKRDLYNFNQLNNILVAHLRAGIQLHRDVEFILQGEFMNVWAEMAHARWNTASFYLFGTPEDYTVYMLYGLAEFKFFGIFSVYYMIETNKSENDVAYVKQSVGHNAGITVWPYPMMAIKFQYQHGFVMDANELLVGEGEVDIVYTAISMSF